MSLKKKTIAVFSGIVLLGGIFAVVNLQSHHTKASSTAQVIHLAETANISTLDVSKMTDAISAGQLDQAGEGLYRFNKNGNVVNALATKTKISDGGHRYTIDMHHNGKWSNGQSVTAQDFVYSWSRTLNPQTKSEFTYEFSNIKNANAVAAGKKPVSSLGLKATSKYQLQVTLSQPAPYFKKLMAGVTYYPINQTAVDKYGKAYGTSSSKMVYDGPFVITGWTGTNDNWTMKKNASYRDKQAVKLQQIHYQVVKSATTAYNLYQSGKLDTITLSGEQNTQNAGRKDLKTLSQGRLGFIQYNEQNKIAANKDLRTAISLALNRQALTKTVLKNGSVPTKTFALHGMLTNPKTGADFTSDAYVKNTVDYNLPLAKKFYRAAQDQLHQKKLSLTITCADDDASKQTTEFIQGELEKNLGLSVNVKSLPFPAMIATVSKGNFQVSLAGWGMDFADPIQALTILTSSSASNSGHYDSKVFDQAIAASEGPDAMHPTARYQDLVKAAKTAVSDQAVTALYESRSRILVKSDLKGVVYNSFNGNPDYQTAYVQK